MIKDLCYHKQLYHQKIGCLQISVMSDWVRYSEKKFVCMAGHLPLERGECSGDWVVEREEKNDNMLC